MFFLGNSWSLVMLTFIDGFENQGGAATSFQSSDLATGRHEAADSIGDHINHVNDL